MLVLTAPPGTLSRDTFVHLLPSPGDHDSTIRVDLSHTTFFTPWGIVGLCNLFSHILGYGGQLEVFWPSQVPPRSYLARIHFPSVLEKLGLDDYAKSIQALYPGSLGTSEALLELLHLESRSDFYDRNQHIVKILMALGLNEDKAYYVCGMMGELVDNVFAHNFGRWPLKNIAGGFLIIQKYPAANRLEIAVSDVGVGIRATLTTNPLYSHIKTDVEAVRKALQRNVTARPQGRGGNGFPFILDALTNGFHGTLDVRSGLCHLRVFQTRDQVLDTAKRITGTMVGITINY